VVLAQDTQTLELVAVKKLPRSPDDRLQLERELLVHSRLRHPHVVRFHEVFLSPNHYNLVLEYVPGA
jgi:serine/threonine-protein kinase SRK2